jgi:hypothetical protein
MVEETSLLKYLFLGNTFFVSYGCTKADWKGELGLRQSPATGEPKMR